MNKIIILFLMGICSVGFGQSSNSYSSPSPIPDTFTALTMPTPLINLGTINQHIVHETDAYWAVNNIGVYKEHYSFKCRTYFDAPTTSGWTYLNIPNITGWDINISDVGEYRVSGNVNNPNNATKGAMADAPFMGNDTNHWSNSNLIYIGQNNDKDALGRYYINYTVEYIRL